MSESSQVTGEGGPGPPRPLSPTSLRLLACGDSSLRPREEGRLRRGTGEGVLQPLRANGGWGVPAGPPGAGADPWDVRPQCLRSKSPWPRGTEGPVRRALRGSLLPVQAAGSRLRSQKHAVLTGRRASSANAHLREGGFPFPPPPSPPPTPAAPRRSSFACPAWAPAGPDTGEYQAKLCSALGCPLASGASPQSPMGHPLSLPRGGGSLAPRPRNVSAFRLSEQRALCPPLPFLRGSGCTLRLGLFT